MRYAFHIDNNLDGKADDIEFEFQFRTEVRGLVDQLGLFVSYLGCGTAPPPCATPLPAITALDGPGSGRPRPAPAVQRHDGPRRQARTSWPTA